MEHIGGDGLAREYLNQVRREHPGERVDLVPPELGARREARWKVGEDALEGVSRLEKRLGDLQKSVQQLRGRLSNTSYIAKAPEHLVKQTQDQLTDAERDAAAVGGAARRSSADVTVATRPGKRVPLKPKAASPSCTTACCAASRFSTAARR